jgi:glycosyltransferase involved in cell wall biosynthesis
MAVYNGARRLGETLDSVLEQRDVDLELIAVDDGSTDDTASMLADRAAADSRVRVFAQPNVGLTRALVRGCAEARGELIARQDAGDRSLPGRLRRQQDYLLARPEVTLISGGTRYVAPEGEDLYEFVPQESAEESTRRLRSSDLSEQRGPPHHGTAMFRRADYIRAGGYRPQFYFAQDTDLWSRLTDFGLLAVLPEALYESVWDEGTISSTRRGEQQSLRRLSLTLQRCRAEGGDEGPLLAEAEKFRPDRRRRGARGHGYYFVARALARRGDPRATKYLRLAIRSNRFHARAWWCLLRSAVSGD